MLTVAILPFLTELFRFVNNMLESTDVSQRKATSLAWFLVTWPTLRHILSLGHVSDADLDRIEAMARSADVPAVNK